MRRSKAMLCPKTLRSVARELRQSAKSHSKLERAACRYRSYNSADTHRENAILLGIWATHFEGQAKAAESQP